MTPAGFSAQACAGVAWDIAADAPRLAAALQARVPDLSARLAEMRSAVPCAHSIAPFTQDDGERAFVRPYRHLRAFYERVPAGAIAFKGTEPFARDRDAHLQALAQFRVDYPARGKSLFGAAEHFAVQEQKIALALTLDEAVDDARTATALQLAHLERFGELARLPVPMLVLQWPDSARDAHLAALLPLLSPRAARIVRGVAASGLAAMVYHYPAVPIRVAHLGAELAADPRPWGQRLADRCDPAQTVDRWIDGVARMLCTGFLPGRIDHIGIGHCLEMQNAVIDGGFVDVGSAVPMHEVHGDRQFLETLMAAYADLARTIRWFLLGPVADAEAEYRNPSLAMLKTLHRVVPALEARVAHHGTGDVRLQRILARRAPYESLAAELGALTPAPLQQGEHQ